MNANLIGLITGVLFGMIIQRSQVIRYDKQINVLLFKDMTIIKFMLTAIIVGMVGVYLLKDLGIAKLSVKPLIFGSIILGGLVFGAGWALAGYCPATSVGALGEGRVDAFWAIAGMVLGAGIFSHIYPFLKKTILTWGDMGKITLPELLHINHWFVIALAIAGVLSLFALLEKK
jgi:hypothetical protein